MTTLIHYEAARRELAEARRVDEVKSIRDKAAAMRLYAAQAKDGELISHATEIKMRAERRAGELLREMAETGQRHAQGGPKSQAVTLSQLGVSNMQSSRWQAWAEMDDDSFERRVAVAKRDAIASVEQSTTEEKQARRAEREREAAATILALPDKHYGVIYADPEWRFEPYSRETGMDRAADNHYPTSELEDIKARDVASIAADNCVLFIWATLPMLPQALEVMTAWGFAYKSACVWRKDRIGTGYWFRNRNELLLVGMRGDVPAPAPGTQWESEFEAPVGEHSEKPDIACEMIESYFPTMPKIELNARRRRAGWDAWGLEAPEEAAE